MVKYKMNLVKSIRMAERRALKHTANMVVMLLTCLGILVASGYFVYFRIAMMESIIERERKTVQTLEAEYRNYQETQSIIDKADVELLDQLLSNRIYWTRTLEAMAKHLPDEQPTSYWVTAFGHNERSKTFSVKGYGYITDKQEQLLALDMYLNKLRVDANYTEAFATTFLKSAVRDDEVDERMRGSANARVNNERVSFEYASIAKGGAR